MSLIEAKICSRDKMVPAIGDWICKLVLCERANIEDLTGDVLMRSIRLIVGDGLIGEEDTERGLLLSLRKLFRTKGVDVLESLQTSEADFLFQPVRTQRVELVFIAVVWSFLSESKQDGWTSSIELVSLESKEELHFFFFFASETAVRIEQHLTSLSLKVLHYEGEIEILQQNLRWKDQKIAQLEIRNQEIIQRCLEEEEKSAKLAIKMAELLDKQNTQIEQVEKNFRSRQKIEEKLNEENISQLRRSLRLESESRNLLERRIVELEKSYSESVNLLEKMRKEFVSRAELKRVGMEKSELERKLLEAENTIATERSQVMSLSSLLKKEKEKVEKAENDKNELLRSNFFDEPTSPLVLSNLTQVKQKSCRSGFNPLITESFIDYDLDETLQPLVLPEDEEDERYKDLHRKSTLENLNLQDKVKRLEYEVSKIRSGNRTPLKKSKVGEKTVNKDLLDKLIQLEKRCKTLQKEKEKLNRSLVLNQVAFDSKISVLVSVIKSYALS